MRPSTPPAQAIRGLIDRMTATRKTAVHVGDPEGATRYGLSAADLEALTADLGEDDLIIYELVGDEVRLRERYRVEGVHRPTGARPPEILITAGDRQLTVTRAGVVDAMIDRLRGVALVREEGVGYTVVPRPPRPPTDQLPATVAQQTFPEAKALAIALADAKKLRRWKALEGEVGLWHQVERSPLQTLLRGNALLDWLGLPATVESLREELRRAGLPAVLLLHTVIAGSLERAEKNRLYVTVAVDDLLGAIGWKPRSAVERETMRHKVWRWMALFDAAQVVGQRPGKYRDPDTKQEIDLQSVDSLIRITGQRKPAQLAFDNSVPPLEVTYAAGPWVEKWRGNRVILSYFGDVRRLAAIPAGKPSGAWAQAVGLALHQKWRERSARAEVAHVGADKALTVRFGTFTRRELLDFCLPDPSVDDVLGGPNPRYAKDYWRDAIALLKQKGVISHYQEIGTLPDKRQGWQDAWLDQRLDVRPTEEGKQAAAEIATRSRAVRQARAKRHARKGQLGLDLGGAA
jgi:hypothetical protein